MEGTAAAPNQSASQPTGQPGQAQPGAPQRQPTAQAPQRSRVSEFNSFSAGVSAPGADGIPGEGISALDHDPIEHGIDPNDPFSPLAGTDAQSQALSVQDQQLDRYDEQGNQLSVDDSVPAEVMTDSERDALLQEHQAWKDSDDLADPLLEKFVVAQVDGQRYRIPVREAIKGYQLHSDYSNKLRQVYAFRDELETQKRGMEALLRDMDDGQKFLDAMAFLGKFEGFHKAAMIYGTQLDAERRMTPEQREVHANLRAMRAEAQRLQRENLQLRSLQQSAPQANQQPTAEQTQQIYLNQLSQLIPRVGERLGFVASPYAMQEFERHFTNMVPSLEGGDLTSDFVERVMRATMDTVEQQVSSHRGYLQQEERRTPAASQPQQQARATNGQFAPGHRRVPPAGQLTGPAASQQRAPTRARIGDFDRGVRGKV